MVFPWFSTLLRGILEMNIDEHIFREAHKKAIRRASVGGPTCTNGLIEAEIGRRVSNVRCVPANTLQDKM